MISLLLTCLISLPLSLAIAPSPTITIASASPASQTSSYFPSPTDAPLVRKCEGGDCSFGGSETTLQASVVTTTIMSTTSVPCYITTYITNSETITETVYSTEIITSTETREGTVFIIQYSPTPVLMSTPITSVMEITNTWWSYWLTSSGDYYSITSSGGETVYGGNSNTYTKQGDGDKDWNDDNKNDGGWGNNGNSATGSAWTHISAGNNAVSATSSISGGVIVGTNNGWGSSSSNTLSNGNLNSNSGNNGFVSWNSGSSRVDNGWELKFTIMITLGVIIFWEITHFFA